MADLYVIKKPEELEGKTIIYISLNRFSDPAIIISADGGVLMWSVNEVIEGEWGNEFEIEHYNQSQVESELFHNDRIVNTVIKTGHFTQSDFDNFFVRQNEEKERQRKVWVEQKEENDRKEFERLKNKFAGEAEV